MSPIFDPRITPLRLDIAARVLEGQVEVPQFADANLKQVRLPTAMMLKAADPEAEAVSQLLYGESFDVYEESNGWAWGQSKVDDYVGYVRTEALGAPPEDEPNHCIKMARTPVFSRPSVKSHIRMLLDLNARVYVAHNHDRLTDDRYTFIEGLGWVLTEALRPIDQPEGDPAAVAQRFLGAAYVWGGRSTVGCDCSGLVQASLLACGIECPRDADMQEEALGQEVAYGPNYTGLRRNDLVFWRGHVGIMLSDQHFLHANAHFMTVTVEPLVEAADRINRSTGPVTSIKRLPGY